MTLEEHLELMEQMAKEWHKENDKPKSVRKAMRASKIRRKEGSQRDKNKMRTVQRQFSK